MGVLLAIQQIKEVFPVEHVLAWPNIMTMELTNPALSAVINAKLAIVQVHASLVIQLFSVR